MKHTSNHSIPLVAFAIVAAFLALTAPPARAADATWNGTTDGVWATGTNWSATPVPGTGDTATFDNAGSGNTTIDLGTLVTTGGITFDLGAAAAYTIGLAGTDTLSIDQNADIIMTSTVANDQIIAADIVLGDGGTAGFSDEIQFNNQSTTNTLIINGDITTGTGGPTPGNTQRLVLGNFSAAAQAVTLNGDINEGTGAASDLDIFVGGAEATFTGTVNTTTNNYVQWFIRDNGTLTVNDGGGSGVGDLGTGLLDVRYGTVNLDADQAFSNSVQLGSTSQGNGAATINIGATNTLALSTGITYFADSGTANTGTIAGGTLQVTGASRTIVVNDNSAITATSPELTITSTITAGGTTGANGDNDLVIRNTGGGTLLLAPTGTANSFGGVTLQEGTLQLGAGGLSSEGDFLTVAARNNAATAPDVVATVDLLGTTHALGDGTGAVGVGGNLTLGSGTANIADNGFQANVVDTVGGGKLTNVNQVIYSKGAGTGIQRNGAATLSADVDYDTSGANKVINIGDGEATTDLTISSALNTTGAASHDFTVLGEGTLSFSGTLGFGGTVGGHDITTFSNQKTILGAGADLGGQRTLAIAQRNNAALSDFAIEFDINGQDLVLRDNLAIGGGTSNFGGTGVISNISITDSVGTGRITMSGSVDGARTITYSAGTGGTNITATLSADVAALGGGVTMTVNDGASDVDLDFTGDFIADTGGRSLSKNGAGTLRLSGTNSTAGTGINFLFINDGRVLISSDANLGDNDVLLGNNTTDGTLEYTGTGETIDNQFRIGDNNATVGTRTGSGAILNNGTGGLTFGNAAFNQTRPAALTDRTVTLGGTNTGGDNTISGAIIDNAVGATIAVTKEGTNTWVLDGDNTYTGATAVNAGTLEISGTNTSAITVGTGAGSGANLDGEGSTSSTLLFSETTHTINADLGTAAALGSTGTGSTDVSALTDGMFTVNISGGPVIGPADILTYGSGGFTGTVAKFVLGTGTVSGRGAAGFADNTLDAITFDAGYASRTWDNTSANGLWQDAVVAVNTTDDNWVEGDMDFYDLDSVIFDDTVAASETVTLSNAGGTITVTDMTISHTGVSTKNFTFDAATTETLTVNGTLTFDGGSGTANNDATINVVIAGAGSLFVGDSDSVRDPTANSLTLSAANTYSGGSTLQEGRVSITNSAALGTGTVTMEENLGAGTANRDPILDLDADALNVANDLVIGNTGGKLIRLDNGGATANTGELSGSITQNETADTNFRLDVGRNDTLTLSGQISGAGGVFARATTQADQGTVILTNAANDFTGNLVVASNVEAASIGNATVASHAGAGSLIVLGASANATPTNNANQDGNLIYTGAGDTSDKQFQVGNYWFTAGNNGTNGGAITNNGTGALVFDNATFNVQESRVAADIGARTLTLAGSYTGVNEIDGIIQDNAATDAFVDETVGVTVDTSGSWQLEGASTFTGNTQVTSGTLQVGVAGTGSLGGTPLVTVDSGATLAGTGTVGAATGLVSISGFLIAGDTQGADEGTLSIGDDLSILSMGEVTFSFDGVTPTLAGAGTSYDQISVADSLNVAVDAILRLEDQYMGGAGSWLPTLGDRFDLFDFAANTGAAAPAGFSHGGTVGFFNLPDISAAGGGSLYWRFDDFDSLGEIYVGVPEPSRAVLVAIGFAFTVLRRRRRS